MVVCSSPVRQQDNPNTLKIPDNVGVVQGTVLLYEKQRTFDARQVLRRKASSDPNPINLPTRGQRQQHPVDKATNLGRAHSCELTCACRRPTGLSGWACETRTQKRRRKISL